MEGSLTSLWQENWGLIIICRALHRFGFMFIVNYEILVGQSKIFKRWKKQQPLSLLICTRRSDFESGRRVVLLTWIFFRGAPTRKKIRVCRTTFLPPSKSLLRVQIKRRHLKFFVIMPLFCVKYIHYFSFPWRANKVHISKSK